MQLGFSVTPTVRYTNEIKEKFKNSLALHSVMISLSLYSLHFLNHCLLNPLKTNNSQACLERWCEKVESLRWSKLKAVLTKTAVHVLVCFNYPLSSVSCDKWHQLQPATFPLCRAMFWAGTITHMHSARVSLKLPSFQNSNFIFTCMYRVKGPSDTWIIF